MEIIDIVDEAGNPTGDTVDRETAHEKGILHRTSHVWIARLLDGNMQLLLQRRSLNKDSHPGCLDISSAGHIPSGCGFKESAVREMKEELGITIESDDLLYCGKRRISYQTTFHNHIFWDNQVSNVYLVFKDVKSADIHLQEEEISEVMWMDYEKIYAIANEGQKDCCVAVEELEMVYNCFWKKIINE